MFLLSAQKFFLYYMSLYVELYVKKNSRLNLMSSVGSQASKIWMFFWKKFYGASLEIIFRQK